MSPGSALWLPCCSSCSASVNLSQRSSQTIRVHAVADSFLGRFDRRAVIAAGAAPTQRSPFGHRQAPMPVRFVPQRPDHARGLIRARPARLADLRIHGFSGVIGVEHLGRHLRAGRIVKRRRVADHLHRRGQTGPFRNQPKRRLHLGRQDATAARLSHHWPPLGGQLRLFGRNVHGSTFSHRDGQPHPTRAPPPQLPMPARWCIARSQRCSNSARSPAGRSPRDNSRCQQRTGSRWWQCHQCGTYR